MNLSRPEAALALALRAATSYTVAPQYRWWRGRRFRADFAIWEDEDEALAGEVLPLLVEVEGGKRGAPGHHQRLDGIDYDCQKYAEAQCQGYEVLRISSRMAHDGRGLAFIERLMERRRSLRSEP